MNSFSQYVLSEANTEKLHRLLKHYGYKATEDGYKHPEMGSSATVSDDGWTHLTADGKAKKGKSRNGLDKHLANLHQGNLF